MFTHGDSQLKWMQRSDRGLVSSLLPTSGPLVQVKRFVTADSSKPRRSRGSKVAHGIAYRWAPSPDISRGTCGTWPDRGDPPLNYLAPIWAVIWRYVVTLNE